MATDNPVKIGYEYISGTDHYCYIVTTSEYEITCRTADDSIREAGETQLIVFASTSEEATCNEAGGCLYSYLPLSDLPTLSSATTSYDEADQVYSIVITGSGMDAEVAEGIQIIIGV